MRHGPGRPKENRAAATATPKAEAPRTAQFRRLLAAQAMHAAGDAAVVVALADTLFFGVPLDGARGRVALFLAVTVAPVTLLTPALAALIARRRWSGGKAMAVLALIRAVAAGALLLAADHLVLLYPLALVMLAASRVYGIGKVAILPTVLPRRRPLVMGNTYSSVATSLGMAAGVAVAAGGTHVADSRAALSTGVTAYAMAALTCWRLPSADAGTRALPSVQALRHRVARPLAGAAVATATLRGASGFLTFLLAFRFRDEPGTFAAVVVAVTVGGALGSVGAPGVRRFAGGARAPAALLSLVGLCVAASSLSFIAPVAAGLGFVAGFSWATGRVLYDAELQRSARTGDLAAQAVASSVFFEVAWLMGSALSLPWRNTLAALVTVAIICCCGSLLSLALLGHRRAPAEGAQ